VLHAGIATHFMPSDNIEHVVHLLRPSLGGPELVRSALNEYTVEPNDEGLVFSLNADRLALIERVFTAPSVLQIMSRLDAETQNTNPILAEWASKLLKDLNTYSPLSLRVTFEQLKRGAGMSLADCFRMEYIMTQRFMQLPDFYSGVDAALISKTGRAEWQPARLMDVTDELVQSFFVEQKGAKQLKLLTSEEVVALPVEKIALDFDSY